jgi:hypothetical protein
VKLSNDKLKKLSSNVSLIVTLLFILFASLAFLELIRPIQAYYLIVLSLVCVLAFSLYVFIKNNYEVITSKKVTLSSVKGKLVLLFYISIIVIGLFTLFG